MEYNGPRTRHYNEVSGDSFTVSGRPHYLERRGITMKQNLTVTQVRTDSDALVPDYFYEEDDEKQAEEDDNSSCITLVKGRQDDSQEIQTIEICDQRAMLLYKYVFQGKL